MIRDTSSNALLENNRENLANYRRDKNRDIEIKKLKYEIEDLKQKVSFLIMEVSTLRTDKE